MTYSFQDPLKTRVYFLCPNLPLLGCGIIASVWGPEVLEQGTRKPGGEGILELRKPEGEALAFRG